MSTIKVNYKSDLPPMSVELTLGGEVQQIPAHDFVLRFFTVYPHRHYDCVFEDGVWTNMEKVDDTHLNVYITNHGLGVGQLHCLYISKAPYEGYDPAYYTTYSLTGMDVELIDGNGDATDGIDAEIAIDIEGVIADCKAATAAAIEITEQMQPIYDRLVGIFPENYYTKTESDGKFHPLYGNREINLNAKNLYLKQLHMLSYEGGDEIYLTNHTSGGNKVSIGNGSKVTVLPWPNENGTWTVAMTKDHYTKTATDNLLSGKVDKESGKSLMTDAEHTKLAGIATGAEVNVQADWAETSSTSDSYIKNKPPMDAAPTENSPYAVTSAGLYSKFLYVAADIADKQDALVSGSNIKTINNQSLLGSGNINISDGGGGSEPMIVTVTESGGTFTADKTFAEVDAALTAGQLVRFFDGVSYFDVTGHIATQTVVASYTTGATNEKFTYTPSSLTWERTFLQVRTSGTTTERNNHSPINLELYYDTTLNKLLICTDAQNRIWKDTMGNTV